MVTAQTLSCSKHVEFVSELRQVIRVFTASDSFFFSFFAQIMKKKINSFQKVVWKSFGRVFCKDWILFSISFNGKKLFDELPDVLSHFSNRNLKEGQDFSTIICLELIRFLDGL